MTGEAAGMGRVLKEASFEEWIEFVFARPVKDPAWYWEDDADQWEVPAERTAELLGETFERAGEALEPFDDEQVNQGLWMIANPVCSDIGRSFDNPAVPHELRNRMLESVFVLFRDCFAVRCSNHLGHFDEQGANPLNSACYMWWDLLPIIGEPDNPGMEERDELVLSVMARILELPSDACRESALHGLGKWEPRYPEAIHEIIDRFIWSNRKTRNLLRNYAYAARHGDVE